MPDPTPKDLERASLGYVGFRRSAMQLLEDLKREQRSRVAEWLEKIKDNPPSGG